MARQLEVSHAIINSDLRAINEQARAVREASQRKRQAQQLIMHELQSQGLTEHEIAQRMGRNVRTVPENLKAMQSMPAFRVSLAGQTNPPA